MGKEVQVIIFVSGIDSKLLGIDINGFVLKKTINTETSEKILNLAEHALGNTMRMQVDYSHKDENGLKSYLYFEKIYENDSKLKTYWESKHLINVLRLFKSSKIGFFHPFYIQESGGSGIFADEEHSYHTRFCFSKLFTLDKDNGEVKEINEFYKNSYNEEKHNDLIEKMLSIFHESYRIFSVELELMLRVIIFEMMIEESVELSYRISRTIAVFLGRDQSESEIIFQKVKNIYNARSKYVHNGQKTKISEEVINDTLDIARRIVANLLFLDLSTTSIKEIYEKCNISGFGSNPFNIKL